MNYRERERRSVTHTSIVRKLSFYNRIIGIALFHSYIKWWSCNIWPNWNDQTMITGGECQADHPQLPTSKDLTILATRMYLVTYIYCISPEVLMFLNKRHILLMPNWFINHILPQKVFHGSWFCFLNQKLESLSLIRPSCVILSPFLKTKKCQSTCPGQVNFSNNWSKQCQPVPWDQCDFQRFNKA